MPAGAWSLRTRLLLLIVLALIPGIALTIAAEAGERDERLQDVRDETLRTARLAALAEERTIEGIHRLMAAMQWLAPVGRSDPALCHAVLRQADESEPAVAGMGVVEPNGNITCSTTPPSQIPPGFRLENATSLERALATKAFSVGNYRVNRLTGAPTMGLALPVLDAQGNVSSVLTATMDLGWLAGRIAETQLPEGQVLTVFDQQGTVLARQPEHARFVGQTLPDPDHRIAASSGTGYYVGTGLDGIERANAVVPLRQGPTGGVYLSVGVPLSIAFASADAEFARSMLVLLAVASFALVAALVFSDRYILPHLARLSKAAQGLARGEFGVRAGDPRDGSEMGQLSRTFDRMAEAVEGKITAERAARQDLQTTVDQLSERDRSRSQFVSMAAHELGNLLTPIVLQTDLMRARASTLGPQDERALGVIERNAQRLSGLVQDVLDAARLQAGRFAVRPEPLDAATVLQDTGETFREAARQKGVRLRVEAPPGLLVQGDARRLAQVLANLVGNALKFTPSGGEVVVAGSREGGQVLVRVEDNGRGFDPALAEALFESFRHPRGPEDGRGAGLGLYISRGIVEQHGGRLWAQSAGPGQGATFAFALPALEAHAAPSLAAPGPAGLPPSE